MASGIHKNIYTIFPNLPAHIVRTHSAGITPVIGKLFDSLRHIIRFGDFGIAEKFYYIFIMRSEQRFHKIGAGMTAKVRRHIADTKFSVRRWIIGMISDFFGQRFCILLIPFAMLFIYPVCRVSGAVMQSKEIIAECLMIFGPEIHGFAIAVNRLVQPALILQHIAHIDIGFGILRLQFYGFEIPFNSLVCSAGFSQSICYIVVCAGTARLKLQCLLVRFNRLVKLSLFF